MQFLLPLSKVIHYRQFSKVTLFPLREADFIDCFTFFRLGQVKAKIWQNEEQILDRWVVLTLLVQDLNEKEHVGGSFLIHE